MPDSSFMATFTGPEGLPGAADDQSTAGLVTNSGSATSTALGALYLNTAQLVISPTEPPSPTVGLVWINNT